MEMLHDEAMATWATTGGEDLAFVHEPRVRRAAERVFLAASVVYPVWGRASVAFLPSARDPLWERLAMAAVILVGLAVGRTSRFVPFLGLIQQSVVFLMTAHFFSLVWRNQAATPYLLGLFVLIGSLATVLSRVRVAVTYSLFVLGLAVALVLTTPVSSVVAGELLLGTATVLTAVVLSSYQTSLVRETAVRRLMHGRELMKRIIEAIPDPVMVKTPEKRLVLANAAGRWLMGVTSTDLTTLATQEDRALAGAEPIEADMQAMVAGEERALAVKTALSAVKDSDDVLITVIRDMTDRRTLELSLRRKVQELQEARDRVRQLEGLLPICMHCRRIRAEKETTWQSLEGYVSQNSSATFTHTICETCFDLHHPP